MNRCSFKVLSLVGTVGTAAVLTSLPAAAAPKDAAVLKLDKAAIYDDYLSTNFAEAEKKLTKALSMCTPATCSAKVRAQLHRDLGIIYIVGLNKAAEGKAEFAEAVKADPGIDLPKELSTPEAQAALAEAKANKGSSRGGAAAEGGASGGGGGAGGDIIHATPAEQAVLTPVPIFAELPPGIRAAKLVVKYKTFGSPDWKSADLRRLDEGWGGEIPCRDVGTTTGELRYFIQAMDAGGDVVAISGTRTQPHTTQIVNQLTGEAPHLPGKPAPAQCANSADCPPGIPGCGGSKGGPRGDKDVGASCDATRECREGLVCKGDTGRCERGSGDEATGSTDDAPGDAADGNAAPVTRNWFSAAFQIDGLRMSEQDQVCTESDSVTCFSSDGEEFNPKSEPLLKDGIDTSEGNKTQGGFVRATMRLMVGYDRLFGNNLLLGGRLGYAFGGGPTGSSDGSSAFLPLHLEARASYWFGNRPFSRAGIRPYALVAFGVGEVDAKMNVNVFSKNRDIREGVPLEAWQKSGRTFAALGPGIMYALTPNSGIFAEAKGMLLFPSSGLAVNLQLGYAMGFGK